MKKGLTFILTAIFLPLLLFFIMAFFEGKDLPGADTVVARVKSGAPVVIEWVLAATHSRIAFFIYGVFFTFAFTHVAGSLPNEKEAENPYAVISQQVINLYDQIETRHRKAKEAMFPTPAKVVSSRMMYDEVFDNLRALEIFTLTPISYQKAIEDNPDGLLPYLAEIGILLENGKLEKARAVNIPYDIVV